MAEADMTVFVTGLQVEFLTSISKLLKIVNLEKHPAGIIILECQSADFSGPLVKLAILPVEDDGGPSYTVWLPHSCVFLALDFSPLRAIGFHGK